MSITITACNYFITAVALFEINQHIYYHKQSHVTVTRLSFLL